MALPKRVYVYCHDSDFPCGGIRRLYRHVDVLCKHGVDATIVHRRPGFRCTWFVNETPIRVRSQVKPIRNDYVVLPEAAGPDLLTLAPGVPTVIFNQNAYLTFLGYPATGPNGSYPYSSPDVRAVLTVSDDNTNYLRYAFPKQRFFRIHHGIDPIFAPSRPKRKAIAYMPRKHADDAVQVFNLLRCHGALNGWEIVPIERMNELEVAERLANSAFFFSFGYPEGFGIPPIEAMACGCVVVGFHGWGGREFFLPEFSYPIDNGDVLAFARTAEQVLRTHTDQPATFDEMSRRAVNFVRANFTAEQEEHDILNAWNYITSAVVDQQSASPDR